MNTEDLRKFLKTGYSDNFWLMQPKSKLYTGVVDRDWKGQGNCKLLCIISDISVKYDTKHDTKEYRDVLQDFADSIGRKFFERDLSSKIERNVFDAPMTDFPNWRVERNKAKRTRTLEGWS